MAKEIIKSVLEQVYDSSCDKFSPVQKDFDRKVNHDDDGSEYLTWEEIDYPKIQRSHGSVSDWSLDALLRAGVNPNFSIHTGNPTRLEGLDALDQYLATADSIVAESNPIEDLPE